VDNVSIIRIVAGIFAVCGFAVGMAYIAFLGTVLSKCSPSSRTMSPGSVWFLLVPFVGIVWNFLVVSALADSLGNEFRLRGIPTSDPKPGKSLGIAMSVCGACMIIPFVNLLAIVPELILWIVYWVKIAGYSRQLNLPPAPTLASANPQGD
jgi:hypothetical protein